MPTCRECTWYSFSDDSGHRCRAPLPIPVVGDPLIRRVGHAIDPTTDASKCRCYELFAEGYFSNKLRALLNTHNREGISDTPDFILADYLLDCLDTFDSATIARDDWYARKRGKKAETPPEGHEQDKEVTGTRLEECRSAGVAAAESEKEVVDRQENRKVSANTVEDGKQHCDTCDKWKGDRCNDYLLMQLFCGVPYWTDNDHCFLWKCKNCKGTGEIPTGLVIDTNPPIVKMKPCPVCKKEENRE
jgi:hypothetical protein